MIELSTSKFSQRNQYGRPERMALPSYMKDVSHYATAIGDRDFGRVWRTLSAKAHPAISAASELLNNRDFYGTQIWTTDTLGQDVLGYLAKSATPFAVRGLQRESELGADLKRKALPFIGVTPAPKEVNETGAERLMDKYISESSPAETRTKERYAQSKAVRDITHIVRLGRIDQATDAAQAAISAGIISEKDISDIDSRASAPPLETNFKRLDADHQADIHGGDPSRARTAASDVRGEGGQVGQQAGCDSAAGIDEDSKSGTVHKIAATLRRNAAVSRAHRIARKDPYIMLSTESRMRDRLAIAAIQARNDLRSVLPKLHRALAAGECSHEAQTALLGELQKLARRNADALRLALKHPEVRPTRQNARSRAAEPLWGVSGAPAEGRYIQQSRRRKGQ